MAFSTTTVGLIKFTGGNVSGLYDDLTSALAANTSSVSSLGGGDCLSRGVVALLDQYRKDPVAGKLLSAGAVVSVHASSTSSLLTIQVQIVPAV